MSEHDVKMIILSTDDLDESIRFYSETLGMPLKFRDGTHFAALDGANNSRTGTAVDHPYPGRSSSVSRPLMLTRRRRRLRPAVVAGERPLRRCTRAPCRGLRQQRQRRSSTAAGPVKDAADISNQQPPRGSWVHTARGSPGPQIALRVRKRSLPNL